MRSILSLVLVAALVSTASVARADATATSPKKQTVLNPRALWLIHGLLAAGVKAKPSKADKKQFALAVGAVHCEHPDNEWPTDLAVLKQGSVRCTVDGKKVKGAAAEILATMLGQIVKVDVDTQKSGDTITSVTDRYDAKDVACTIDLSKATTDTEHYLSCDATFDAQP